MRSLLKAFRMGKHFKVEQGMYNTQLPENDPLKRRSFDENWTINMEDYLYINTAKIESYFDQVSTPVIYDKVPVVKASAGINALSVEATQSRFPRPPTIYEKLDTVRKSLYASNEVITERAHGGIEPDQNVPFREETVIASKVRFAPREGQDDPTMGLTLWLAYPEWQNTDPTWQEANGSLYLLQDYIYDDRPIYHFLSPASFLAELMRDTPSSIHQIVGGLPGDWREMEYEMRIDPDKVLRDLGAKIGLPRRIRSLYRVRTFYRERPHHRPRDVQPATFGYPLFIVEAP